VIHCKYRPAVRSCTQRSARQTRRMSRIVGTTVPVFVAVDLRCTVAVLKPWWRHRSEHLCRRQSPCAVGCCDTSSDAPRSQVVAATSGATASAACDEVRAAHRLMPASPRAEKSASEQRSAARRRRLLAPLERGGVTSARHWAALRRNRAAHRRRTRCCRPTSQRWQQIRSS
jgi:hypothetical protein